MLVDAIGFAAGILMAISMLPQILQSYKTKSVKDVSLLMLLLVTVGGFLWMVYGILIKSAPVAIMDGLTFLMGLTQVFIKLKYGKKNSDYRKPDKNFKNCYCSCEDHNLLRSHL